MHDRLFGGDRGIRAVVTRRPFGVAGLDFVFGERDAQRVRARWCRSRISRISSTRRRAADGDVRQWRIIAKPSIARKYSPTTMVSGCSVTPSG